MADRPILFSGPMVRALLAGTKTQTRRALNPQPMLSDGSWSVPWRSVNRVWQEGRSPAIIPNWLRISVGDRLYVRETFSGLWEFEGIPPREWPHPYPLWYWAAGNPPNGDWTNPRPGIHMPRWASRITLTVTDVRVERLQDISEDDAQAEGTPPYQPPVDQPPVEKYWAIWEEINGPGSWDTNPWVAAYTFTVAMGNIDQLVSEAA